MDLNAAIAKHAEWKLKFRSAISRQESMDEKTIAKDNCCELGKWIHLDAKLQFGELASYSTCLNAHRLFHIEAGKVAQAINARKYQEAERMLGGGTPYAIASGNVGIAILGLKKEAKL